jgi:hypothetical protein
MDESGRAAWLDEAITEVFLALAASPALSGALVYKGARILDLRLQRRARASVDIDANLSAAFAQQVPSRDERRRRLEREIRLSLDTHTRRQSTVRHVLEELRIDAQPNQAHPLGFDAYKVRIRFRDARLSGIRGLPSIDIDIAAPEVLGPSAVSTMQVGAHTVQAYTLPRIAGEKLRAFLQSLPEYREKLARPGAAIRVKDLYDLASILETHPISDQHFWEVAGTEFRTACRSRFVDCMDVSSFEQTLALTQRSYETDSTIPGDKSWDTSLTALREIASFLERRKLLGFRHALPDTMS